MEKPFTYVFDGSQSAMCPKCGGYMLTVRPPHGEVTEPEWKYRRWICQPCELAFHVPLVQLPAIQVTFPVEVPT